MSEKQIKNMIADAFNDIADALETGSFGKEPIIGVAAPGTELGMDNIQRGINLAAKKGYKAVIIDGENAHEKMDAMLAAGDIDAAVTMHYPFPIGVSTVGRVVTPAEGREMYLATTTGTSSTDRIEGMIKNTLYGIIAAKATGVERPTVGIANIDGARQTEKALLKLNENGYEINFATSSRADGGIVMRGNDLLQATADVMVTDPLTGNLMMKIFSAYTTGGSYESTGFGYGPGIGENFDKIILIVSRASGAPVIAGAIEYASQLVKNQVLDVARKEFEQANKAGLGKILQEIKGSKKNEQAPKTVSAPPKEVVTHEIHGIEVIDLEDAASALWEKNIYAETGMGCTGPVILVSEPNSEAAKAVLTELDYIK
ncbi:hypothetical protein M2140_001175 [Clostridiales Family XIII bacterium PM5-7]